MAKRRREELPGVTIAVEECYTLFIDTSLDTHLAMIISRNSTVADVKKNIVLEHSKLFPSIGEIQIISLQVKRQGLFYHLPDSMFVISAYEGSKRHKSLFVEASSSEHNKELTFIEPEIKKGSSSDQNVVDIVTTLDHTGQGFPTILEKRQQDVIQDLVGTSPSDTITRPGAPNMLRSKPAAEKSHKLLPCEADKDLDNLPDSMTVPIQIVDHENFSRPFGHSIKRMHSDLTHETSGARKRAPSFEEPDPYGSAANVELEASAVDPTVRSPMKHQSTDTEDLTSAVVIELRESMKGDTLAHDENIYFGSLDYVAIQSDNDSQNELAVNYGHQVILPERCKCLDQSNACETNTESVVRPKLLEMGISMDSLIPDGAKKKKRAKNKVSGIRTDFVGEQTKTADAISSEVPNLVSENHVENENLLPQAEDDHAKEVELEKGLSVILPERCKLLDQSDARGTITESVVSPKVLGTGISMESLNHDSTKKKKKKKKVKKKVSGIQTDFVGEQTDTADAISSKVPNLVSENHIENESLLPYTENCHANEGEVEKGLTVNQEERPSEVFKPAVPGEVKAANNKEVILSPDFLSSNDTTKANHSIGGHRKKRKTSSKAKIQDIAKIVEDLNTVEGISPVMQDVASCNQMTDNYKNSKTDVHYTEPGQTTEIAGDGGLPLKHGNKVIEPPVSKPVDLGDTNANINDSVTTVMISDPKGLISDSKQKKRTKKSASSGQDYSCMQQTDHENGLSRRMDANANMVMDDFMSAQRILSHDGEKKASELENGSASCAQSKHEKVVQNEEVYQTHEKTPDMNENVSEVIKNNQGGEDNGGTNNLPGKGQLNVLQDPALDESASPPENHSSAGTKEKKKRKKSQIAAAENISTSDIQKQNLASEEFAVSGDVKKGLNNPSKTTKRKKSIKGGPPQIEATSSEVPFKGRPEIEISDENKLETSKGEVEGITFRNYFVPAQHENDVGSPVQTKEISHSMKPKKKKDKHNAVTGSTLKSFETHGNGKPSDGRNANDSQLEGSADNQHEVLPLANMKTFDASQDDVHVPTSDLSVKRTIEKAIKPAVASVLGASSAEHGWLEKKNGSSTAPVLSSKSKTSGKVVQTAINTKQQSSSGSSAMSARKGSIRRDWDPLGSSRRGKSLLSTQLKLFNVSASFNDEDNIINSDASTRTLSEDSSSGSSTGISDSSHDSKVKGSDNTKTKGGTGKNISSGKISYSETLTMDMVLRSSRSFKKAKLAASQSEADDTDSQVDGFVPGSQANK